LITQINSTKIALMAHNKRLLR